MKNLIARRKFSATALFILCFSMCCQEETYFENTVGIQSVLCYFEDFYKAESL